MLPPAIVAYSAEGLIYRTPKLRNPQSRRAERQCSLWESWFSDPRRVNHQTIIFSPNEVNGNTTEWVKDKRPGGSGQRAEEEEDAEKWKKGWDMSQGVSAGNSGQSGIAE